MPWRSSSRIDTCCRVAMRALISLWPMPIISITHQQCMAFSTDASSVKGMVMLISLPLYSADIFVLPLTALICDTRRVASFLRDQVNSSSGSSLRLLRTWLMYWPMHSLSPV